MLDAYIIEELNRIEREKRERAQPQPQLPLPIPMPYPEKEKAPDKRGPIVIQL